MAKKQKKTPQRPATPLQRPSRNPLEQAWTPAEASLLAQGFSPRLSATERQLQTQKG